MSAEETNLPQLKTHLEFYFSPANLANDSYLRSHMDSNRYVPIVVIASFPKVKLLTNGNEIMLLQAIQQIKTLELNNEKTHVRPKVERTTLIIRDLPSDTVTKDTVLSFFTKELQESINSIKPDVDNTWFVEFKTESSCTDASLHLFTQQYDNKPIRCRISAPQISYYFTPISNTRVNNVDYDKNNVYMVSNNKTSINNTYHNINKSNYYDKVAINNEGDRRHYKSSKPMKGPYRKDRSSFAMHDFPALNSDKTAATTTNNVSSAITPSTTVNPTASNNSHNKEEKKFGYRGEFIKFTREKMAEVVNKVISLNLTKPSTFPLYAAGTNDVLEGTYIRKEPLKQCSLLEPIPVMYPASPSPELAMKPVTNLPPFLDLASYTPANTLVNNTTLPKLESSSLPLLGSTNTIATINNNTTSAPAVAANNNKRNNNSRKNASRRFNNNNSTTATANTSTNKTENKLNFAHIVSQAPSAESLEKAQAVAIQLAAVKLNEEKKSKNATTNNNNKEKSNNNDKDNKEKETKEGGSGKKRNKKNKDKKSENKSESKKNKKSEKKESNNSKKEKTESTSNNDGKPSWADMFKKQQPENERVAQSN